MTGVKDDTSEQATAHGRAITLSRWRWSAALLLLLVLPVSAYIAVPLQAQSDDTEPAFENLEGDETPLFDVRIEGNKTIPAEEIARKIKTRPGRPPNAKLIKEDVRTLYATKWFFSVEPRYRKTEDGLVLVFRIVERPILQKVEYKGNKKLKTKDLANLTGMKPGGAYDVQINREAVRRIENYYREKGYLFAKVTLEKGGQKDEREVIFQIEEGPKVHVTKVTFDGNKDFTDA